MRRARALEVLQLALYVTGRMKPRSLDEDTQINEASGINTREVHDLIIRQLPWANYC
jgi:hypothetical protein